MLHVNSIVYNFKNDFSLSGISFDLAKGQVLGIIGESGCGKTTLLKIIFGEYDLDEGTIYWNDDKILGPSNQLIPGHDDMKYVTQEHELMPYISVLENIIKPLSRQYMSENHLLAKKLIKIIGLEGLENRRLKELSGGQKQRVALAQTLIKKPKLLLLDEPFSHIDSSRKNRLRYQLFQYLKANNIACIIATHDMSDALSFSHKILVLKDGRVLDYNSPQELYNHPKSSYVAGLFGDFNSIDSKLISKNIKSSHTIVYPNELSLAVSDEIGLKITHQYFMGGYYKIVVNDEDKIYYLYAPQKLNEEKYYSIKINSEKILKRLGKNN